MPNTAPVHQSSSLLLGTATPLLDVDVAAPIYVAGLLLTVCWGANVPATGVLSLTGLSTGCPVASGKSDWFPDVATTGSPLSPPPPCVSSPRRLWCNSRHDSRRSVGLYIDNRRHSCCYKSIGLRRYDDAVQSRATCSLPACRYR
jgi:hypothetical protein